MNENIEKTLKELDNIIRKFKTKTNENILIKHGLTEQITDFQKPIIDTLEKVAAVNAPQIENENVEKVNETLDEKPKNFNFKNLTKTITPKLNAEGMIINKKVLPVKEHNDKRIMELPNREKIEINEEVNGLLFGKDLNDVKDTDDLKTYQKILKSVGVNRRTARFKKLTELAYGSGFPVDLTNKSSIDLFIELNKLKQAKDAGNNNTLARASVILDHLLKKHKSISKEKYRKLLQKFT